MNDVVKAIYVPDAQNLMKNFAVSGVTVNLLGNIEPEWLEWYLLTPRERFAESAKLWDLYLSLGGSLDPEVDTQNPFIDAKSWGEMPSHEGPGLRLTRLLSRKGEYNAG